MKWRVVFKKNTILGFLALCCISYFVCFWMGTETALTVQYYEKAAEEERRADTEILAPNVRLQDEEGNTVQMRALYNERPTYVLFWLPWNEDSKKQLALAQEAYEAYGQDVSFAVIAVGSDSDEAAAYYRGAGYDMPLYTGDISVAYEYNAYVMPQSILIDKGGAICGRRTGIVPSRELAYMIEKIREP